MSVEWPTCSSLFPNRKWRGRTGWLLKGGDEDERVLSHVGEPLGTKSNLTTMNTFRPMRGTMQNGETLRKRSGLVNYSTNFKPLKMTISSTKLDLNVRQPTSNRPEVIRSYRQESATCTRCSPSSSPPSFILEAMSASSYQPVLRQILPTLRFSTNDGVECCKECPSF